MTLVITHASVTNAAPNNDVLVDGPKWDANHTLTGVVAPEQGGTGVANASASTITIVGAFGVTWTATATTNVTLPVTGTLATLAGTEALTNKTYNGNTWTAGTGVLTIAAAKTLTASNTLTLAGTDGTTQTFPSTSATIARTDTGQTFTGTNAFGTITFGTGTITGLTNKASPVAGDDYLIIYDSAGAAIKKATVGAVAATADRRVSVLEYIPTNLHADIVAGTSATDVSSYFQDAIDENAGLRPIDIPAGTYVLENGLTWIPSTYTSIFAAGLQLIGEGAHNTILDNRAGAVDYTNTFATTNASNVVTITRTAHGLAVDSQITIVGASTTSGGLSMDGTWNVATVPTANTFTFIHTSTASSTDSDSITYGVVDPLIDLDTAEHSKFQHYVHLSDFKIVNTTSPTQSTGIRLRRVHRATLERLWIYGMQADGIHITAVNQTAGDRDGGNMIAIRQTRIDNCEGWGINCHLRSASVGANEMSYLSLEDVFVNACGTTSVASPPPSGGIRWKGQILRIDNAAAVLCENVGLYIEGASGLANTVSVNNFTVENTKRKGIYITGLQQGEFTNIQIYNSDSYTATRGLEVDGTSYAVTNLRVRGAVVRATSGNSAYTAFYLSGTNADAATCSVDPYSVAWADFDYAGQTRITGWGAGGDVPHSTVMLTLRTTAPSGWLMFADQTMGSASSGATYANLNAMDVFTSIFNGISDADSPILTSAGAGTTRAAQTNAATAWAANCRITMPRALGRALAVAGAGSGLTSRALGAYVGEETHTPTLAEMFAHDHTLDLYLSDATGAHNVTTTTVPGGGGTVTNTSALAVNNTGSSTAFNVLGPRVHLNAIVKL